MAMKYLIVVLVVVLVAWWLLRERPRPRPAAPRKAPPAAQPLEIVACRHCGVHLPRAECVEGGDGPYCSEAHRLAGPRPP